ncbi:MAG: hypothetical protein WBM44_24270 [Waterburya sp.]
MSPIPQIFRIKLKLSAQFLTRSNLPPEASDDAVHIAAATLHGVD